MKRRGLAWMKGGINYLFSPKKEKNNLNPLVLVLEILNLSHWQRTPYE